MKIQIALAGSNFGTNYSDWQSKMQEKPNFGEIKRLDDNKMVALDKGGNIIETYVVDSDSHKANKTDTMGGQQSGAPIEKTQNDTRTGDPSLDKDGV